MRTNYASFLDFALADIHWRQQNTAREIDDGYLSSILAIQKIFDENEDCQGFVPSFVRISLITTVAICDFVPVAHAVLDLVFNVVFYS